MAWFKVDDGFHSSRKLLSIPKRHRLAAAGVWVIAGSWCADQLTDGHVPDYMLKEWGATPAIVSALIEAGLWERMESSNVFYKWHEYQPSKRDVDAEREASRERMREIRARRKQRKPLDSAASGEVFGRTVENGSENVRNPDPTRPDPTPTTTPKGVVGKARETPLPDNWAPTDEHRSRASTDGLDVDREAIKFRAHAEEKGRKAKSWNAAFTRWLINAAEYAKRDGARGTRSIDRQGDLLKAEMARAVEADARTQRMEIGA